MKIAICDDELKDREIIRNFVISHDNKHEIFEYNSAIPLLEDIYDDTHFDVLFLDIQMPDSDGWEVAKKLKRAKTNIYIAMVTIKHNYIHDCFDRVHWFADKPVSEDRIHRILDDAYERLHPTTFEFVIDKVTIVLAASEIIYIEVKHNNVYIHTDDSVYKVRESLKNINKQFDLTEFTSTHRSYLINLEHFETVEVGDSQIILKNGDCVPLSRNKIKHFYSALREYIIRTKSNG